MFVRLKLYGTLRRLSNPETPGAWEGEIPTGNTIREAILLLGAGQYEACAAAMDGEPCSLDTVILEGKEITIVTPMGGG